MQSSFLCSHWPLLNILWWKSLQILCHPKNWDALLLLRYEVWQLYVSIWLSHSMPLSLWVCLWRHFQKRSALKCALSKADSPPRGRWASCNPLKAWVEQKGRGGLNLLSAWLHELVLNLVLPSAFLGLRPSDADRDPCRQQQPSGLCAAPPTLLAFQPARSRRWDFPASMVIQANIL